MAAWCRCQYRYFAGLTNFDGKFFGSLRRLLFTPGQLTQDWIRGTRVRNLRPIQLFLFANVVVILIGKWWSLEGLATSSFAAVIDPWEETMRDQANELGLPIDDYEKLYLATAGGIARSTVVLLIPIAAVLSFALNAWKERRLGVHLAFATHAITFLLLVPDMLLMSTLEPALRRVSLESGLLGKVASGVGLALPFIAFALWWFLGCRRAFYSGRAAAAIQSIVATVLFLTAGLIAHQYIVFQLTIRELAP